MGYSGEVGRARSQEVQARMSQRGTRRQSRFGRTHWAAPIAVQEGRVSPKGAGTGSGPLDDTCCHALFHPQSTDPP